MTSMSGPGVGWLRPAPAQDRPQVTNAVDPQFVTQAARPGDPVRATCAYPRSPDQPIRGGGRAGTRRRRYRERAR